MMGTVRRLHRWAGLGGLAALVVTVSAVAGPSPVTDAAQLGHGHLASAPARPLGNAPVVAVAADQMTGGYWLAASDGGVFAFNAPFFGSAGNLALARRWWGWPPRPMRRVLAGRLRRRRVRLR